MFDEWCESEPSYLTVCHGWLFLLNLTRSRLNFGHYEFPNIYLILYIFQDMVQYTRREALIAGSSVLLSGCTSTFTKSTPTPTPRPPDDDSDGVPNQEDQYPNNMWWSKRLNRVSETVTLNIDDYKAYTINPGGADRVFRYETLVKQDIGIDVMVLNRDEFLKYIDGEDTTYRSAYSMTNVRHAVMDPRPIGDGRYKLVLDYTAYATDYQSTSVEVDVTLEVGT